MKTIDLEQAQSALTRLQAWENLKREHGLSGNQAARALQISPTWTCRYAKRLARDGVAGLARKQREDGAGRRIFAELPPWFVPTAKFFFLLSNLHGTRGSIPEAIRRTIALPACPPAVQGRLVKVCEGAGWTPANGEKLPSCPPALRESILARAKARKPLLPETIARQIAVAAPFVRHHRNPTDASLDYISAHGTQMWLTDHESGEKVFIHGGDVVECDDATVNFPVCVPWPMRGCPCSEKFGVKVARFQWLVAMDVGSRKVLGFSYTARPKGSYRAEDALSLMRCVCRQHGTPRVWRLEQGIWAANRVIDAVKLMGSGRIAVHSPHAKPFIEGLFNKLWTKLSVCFPDASVGRFMGEHEESNRLLVSCQSGATDPRRHFPMLADVIAAFNAVIAEHNGSEINSVNYGRWTPDERWTADTTARPLNPLNPESEWLFAPWGRVWKVKGCKVGGKVPLFPGLSVPFDFQAPCLLKWHGACVTAYFDPADAPCIATLALAEQWAGHPAGEVIGTAPQVNETTDYIRKAMGWQGQSDGLAQIRAAHTALRREVRGIVPPGSTTAPVSESEEHDGRGNLAKILMGTESPPPVPTPAPVVEIDLMTRRGKIQRLPMDVREELNRRIKDGAMQKRLVEWLNELPIAQEILRAEFNSAAITEQNLSVYRGGEYRHWLRQQDAATPAAAPDLNRIKLFTLA